KGLSSPRFVSGSHPRAVRDARRARINRPTCTRDTGRGGAGRGDMAAPLLLDADRDPQAPIVPARGCPRQTVLCEDARNKPRALLDGGGSRRLRSAEARLCPFAGTRK